jgi:hypothetical protein
MYNMTRWPSGLRRNVKAVVFISVGSNPTRVILLLDKFTIKLHFSKLLKQGSGNNEQLTTGYRYVHKMKNEGAHDETS